MVLLGEEAQNWTHLKVLLGEDAKVEARYGPIGDGAKLDAR
jgi:hypothetical protein